MALSTEAAAVNSAVDSLITAYKAWQDTLSAGDRMYLVGVNDNMTKGATAPTFSVTGTMKRIEQYPGSYIYKFDGGAVTLRDLFFKVTNAAGDLT